MRVLYDHQIFSSQKYGGVSKYFAEIINVLNKDIDISIAAWLSNNEYSMRYGLFDHTPFFPKKNFRGKGLLMEKLGIPRSIYEIIKGNYDILHVTSDDDYCLPFLKKKPLVITYHDVNFLTDRDYSERRSNRQKKYVGRADKIVAVSQHTKEDMLKYFDIPEEKIVVIHHGVSKTEIPNSKKERILPYDYILYVGMRHGYKNFERFVKAFALIKDKYPEVKIVCTRNAFSPSELALFCEVGIEEDRMVVFPANEIDLACLYRDALFFIYPSIYEGFGMPILEAMINGCPTLLANASCFPEIAQNAAEYFDPYDIDSIKICLDRMLCDKNLRDEVAARGLQHVANFSWEKCAYKHLELYKSLI